MKIRGIRLFPLGMIVLSTSLAYAQSTVGAAADLAAPDVTAPAPPPPPPPPARPAELPPKPAKVTCNGDMLTIAADNSTLDSILVLVRGCTGAKIDVPEGASKFRSFEQFGPGPARTVLDQLLSGTQYNYVIQSSDQNPAKVETVLLSMRTGDVPGGASNSSNALSTEIASTAGRRAWSHMQKFDKPDPNSETDMNAQAAAEAAFGGDTNTPVPAEPADANAASAAPNAAPAAPSTDADAAAAAANAAPPASATPAASLNPSADPKSAIQDRINSMQQMFDQRRQMIQKQNGTPAQNSGPSN
jgi:hypothetical protein